MIIRTVFFDEFFTFLQPSWQASGSVSESTDIKTRVGSLKLGNIFSIFPSRKKILHK